MTHNPNDTKILRTCFNPTQTQRVHNQSVHKHDKNVYTNETKLGNREKENFYKNKVGDERTRQEIGDAPTHPPVNAGGMKLKSYKPKC